MESDEFVAPGTVLVIGLLCLCVAVFLYRRTKKFLARALRAEGEVVEIVEQGSNEEGGKALVARVRFTRFDGHTIEFLDNVGLPTPRYQVGAIVPVIYDPDIEGGAQIPGGFGTWAFTGIFLVTGAGLVLIGGLQMLFGG